MAARKFLGEHLTAEERILLAQMAAMPGWKILVKLIAESCRNATEEVIRLDPTSERYIDRVAGLQTTARAMNKFSAELLDSVKIHQDRAMQDIKPQRVIEQEQPKVTRFDGFKPPAVKQSPPEGEQSNQS